MTIRECNPADFDAILAIINDAAVAYRGAIAADRWKDPYMSPAELRRQLDEGVVFWCALEETEIAGVMGLQHVREVALIRHAYTRTASQGKGVGTLLLAHALKQADRPVLVGTWEAAKWAIRFYEKHGFTLLSDEETDILLRRYWNIPERQVEESVVLADTRWLAIV